MWYGFTTTITSPLDSGRNDLRIASKNGDGLVALASISSVVPQKLPFDLRKEKPMHLKPSLDLQTLLKKHESLLYEIRRERDAENQRLNHLKETLQQKLGTMKAGRF